MSKLLSSTPKSDGFFAPNYEYEQEKCWMIWPYDINNWRLNAFEAQKAFSNVANIINKYVPVTIIVNKDNYQFAKQWLKNFRLIEMTTNVSWIRDNGPIFLTNKKGKVRILDLIFNFWGLLSNSNLIPWIHDDKIAEKIAMIEEVDYYRAPFVGEGGMITTDGEGTLFITEECGLDHNRNPGITKTKMDEYLKEYYGADKVIWLPLGLYNDKTKGHIDNILHVIKPGKVMLVWTDDINDPQYQISNQALKALENEIDAKGRKIEVVKLPLPEIMYYNEEDIKTTFLNSPFNERVVKKERMAANYVNYYVANHKGKKAIIMPIFNSVTDKAAINIIKREYPNHIIETVYTREILFGGGNIHCITQQQIKKVIKK